MTNTSTAAPEPCCQFCSEQVRWARTEHGYAGFVHTATGLARCAKALS